MEARIHGRGMLAWTCASHRNAATNKVTMHVVSGRQSKESQTSSYQVIAMLWSETWSLDTQLMPDRPLSYSTFNV